MEFICKCGHKSIVEFDKDENSRIIPCSNCYNEEWIILGEYDEPKEQKKLVKGYKLECFRNGDLNYIQQ
ncbi:MAG: hypothetical protein ACK5SE_14535 [Pseudanabaena sp.]|jgi:hypothetical protein